MTGARRGVLQSGSAVLAALTLVVAQSGTAWAHTPTWTAKKALLPSGVTSSTVYLQGLSCPGGHCTAAGYYVDSSNNGVGLAETLTAGKWTPTGLPAQISGLACSGAAACVGAVYGYPDLVVDTASSWAEVPVAAPAGGSNLALYLAGCWSNGCAAVGTYDDAGGNRQMAVATGSGSSWTATGVAVPAGLPAGYSLSTSAMSCSANGSCESVNFYYATPGPGPEDTVEEPIVVKGSAAKGWTAGLSPLPSDAEGYVYGQSYPVDRLTSVSCPAPGGACVATGSYTNTTGAQAALILSGNHAVAGPVPAGGSWNYAGAGLSGVSCPQSSSCTIVGAYEDSSFRLQGAVITGSGLTWTVSDAAIPLPTNASSVTPVSTFGVSCGSTTLCGFWATYQDISNNAHFVLETGSGSTWSPVEANSPNKGYALGNLNAISCYKTHCWAVGYYLANGQQGLIEQFS